MHSQHSDGWKKRTPLASLFVAPLFCALALVTCVGCRSQSTAMSNPFLSPDRVPPPATRTLLPGTAQPYYPGDPLPNSSAIGAPPAGYVPGAQVQPAPTFVPQPAGTAPPNGWNSAPQSIPAGQSPQNVVPNAVPYGAQGAIQVQPDQQALRFAQAAPGYQQPIAPAPTQTTLPPVTPDLPTPRVAVSPYPNRLATYQSPLAQQQFVQPAAPTGQSREVRIRAISSENLPAGNGTATGATPSRDGFRPQGSSQVRKPLLIDRLRPQQRTADPDDTARFGHSPDYSWLRGELQYASGQWSLRYVPTQEKADAFGGRLPITNPQVLGLLQPGEHVQLRGNLDAGSSAYLVSVVQRQEI